MNRVILKLVAAAGVLCLILTVGGCGGNDEIAPGTIEDVAPQTQEQIQSGREESLKHMPPEYRKKMHAKLKQQGQ
jgi:hypothetical protein